ncbi:hypothetical protein SAMN04489806_0947 [Paramicrobacterium humi]|uniref:Uncharacterized protein n=1 Tax=Paramicrobacterium humi TaxID=640635 RepID=A0A1H4K012_9MICO|nr:hypothetical protein [Microbacterium humi]SEB51767.1 hypothetical protein SAMN04489806_0947 [Microbacterium humi]
MRGSGLLLVALVVCGIPLAIGIAWGQSWPTYVTYVAWGVFAVVAIIRSLVRRRRRSVAGSVMGAGEVYNELYLGRPRTTVTYGSTDEVVAEEQLVRRDELGEGVVHLDTSPSDHPGIDGDSAGDHGEERT